MNLIDKRTQQIDVVKSQKDNYRKQNAVNSSGHMRQMIDASGLFFIEIYGNSDKHETKKKRRKPNRDKHDPHITHRIDQYIRKTTAETAPEAPRPK